MAEENDKEITMSSDDISVLRVLLHSIKGISPVSTTEMSLDFLDDELNEA